MSHELPSLDPADYPPGYFDEYCGGELIATSVAFIVIEVAFGTLYYTSRKLYKAPTGLDDWCTLPALVINVAVYVNHIVLVNVGGVGRHLPAVLLEDPTQLERWSKGIFAEVYLSIAYALPKMAILGFFLRFFTHRWERMVTYGLMGVIVATYVGTMITNSLQCIPIEYVWDKTIPGGACIDVQAFFRWLNFPNIITDLIMLVLPMPMVWRLQTSRSQKLGLTVVFATGGIGLISAVIRFAVFYSSEAFVDNTWASVELLKWTVVETGVYFCAACMPSLRPIILHFKRRHEAKSYVTGTSGSSQPTKDKFTGRSATLPFGKGGVDGSFERMGDRDPESLELARLRP